MIFSDGKEQISLHGIKCHLDVLVIYPSNSILYSFILLFHYIPFQKEELLIHCMYPTAVVTG